MGPKQPPHPVLHWRTGGGATWAIREGRYKLLQVAKDTAPQLYDLQNDIGESKDIAPEKPELVAKLKQGHEAWNAELVSPIFESPKAAPRKAKREAAQKK